MYCVNILEEIAKLTNINENKNKGCLDFGQPLFIFDIFYNFEITPEPINSSPTCHETNCPSVMADCG